MYDFADLRAGIVEIFVEAQRRGRPERYFDGFTVFRRSVGCLLCGLSLTQHGLFGCRCPVGVVQHVPRPPPLSREQQRTRRWHLWKAQHRSPA